MDVMKCMELLAALGIGFVGGMLHMRRNYLALLRHERAQCARITRHAGDREREARYLGYAVGYREGSRAR